MALGAGRRIRYLLDRARAVDLGNLFRLAGLARRVSWRPRVLLVADMLWSAVRYEVAFQDYVDWDFALLSPAERRTWMTHPKSNHLALLLNSREHRATFADKIRFNARFGAYLGREWIDLRDADATALAGFALRHGAIIVKVPDSLGGKGIDRIDAAEVADWGVLHARLLERRQFLVEELLGQHLRMASLNPSSVNTLRVITFRAGDRVHLLASVLKIGNGGPIDNFSHGGMYTMLDAEGVARYAAFDGAGDAFEVHPVSGTPILGFRVPLYERVLGLVDRLAREVAEMPYIGWDIAITPDGPVVIEGNYNTGVFQPKPSVSGVRIGLLPRYREAIGF